MDTRVREKGWENNAITNVLLFYNINIVIFYNMYSYGC